MRSERVISLRLYHQTKLGKVKGAGAQHGESEDKRRLVYGAWPANRVIILQQGQQQGDVTGPSWTDPVAVLLLAAVGL